MTATLYDTWALGDPDGFEVDATGYHVGGLLFSDCVFSPARFRRDHKHLQQDGGDFLVLQEQLEAEEVVSMEHGIVRLLPEHLYLRDWGLPFDSQATAMRLRSVVIPRRRLSSGVVPSEGNPVLSWPLASPEGRFLHHLWSALVGLFPEAELGVAESLCEGFLGFLKGVLGSDTDVEMAATLRSMEHYLRVRLRGSVGVEDLCRRFHVSRSTVYRLFEPHGGVQRFLQLERLKRCFDDLRFANPRRVRVGDVAASWGYLDLSAFSRRFRSCFGMPPSEVLGSAFADGDPTGSELSAPDESVYGDYRTWLSRASGRT